MNIKTTIYIDIKHLEKMNNFAKKWHISQNRLISMLINQTIQQQDLAFKSFQSVKYQKRQEKHCWHTFHVSFHPALYEHCTDLRNFCKFSLSFIIAFAIKNYLQKIEKKLLKMLQNNLYSDNYIINYTFIVNNNKKIPFFTIYWGKPEG